MIPIILFLGFSPEIYVWFQIVQTGLDYLLVFSFLYTVLQKLNPSAYNRKKLLLTALGIEGVHVISFFMWFFLVYYAIGGFIIELIFLFIVPFFVIYLFYTPDTETLKQFDNEEAIPQSTSFPFLSTSKAWLLYICSVLPALLLSSLLSSILFNLFGFHNVFIFS
ncbi:MAG: hypothetical protein ACTSRS_07445 [Candidatus Helarchaeota archaeon]